MAVSAFFEKYLHLFTLLLVLVLQPVFGHNHSNKYIVSNLVANTNSAPNQDPLLVNPWGLAIGRNGDFFVADNGTNLITSYTAKGSIDKIVVNALSSPTGLVYNDYKHHFKMLNTKHSAKLILSTENGTILAFNHKVDPHNAFVVADRSAFGTVYKGLVIANNQDHYFIYAADFFNAKIDVFDANFNYVFSFTDPTIPTGFAPFNIQEIDKKLYVTYAKQKGPSNHDDQSGPGNGFVDVFNLDGSFSKRLISNGVLNSPWGLALVPHDFGAFSQALLVGNFGDGIINAFNAETGAFLGHLNDENGNPIVIDGLWALQFKPYDLRLYFSSGPNDESNGLAGVILLAPNHHHH